MTADPSNSVPFSPAQQAEILERVRPTPRIREAIACYLGNRSPQYADDLQRPTKFYVPGLAARPWHDKRDFPWTAALESAGPAMRSELQAVRAAREFQDYAQPQGAIHKDGLWKSFYFFVAGRAYEDNCKMCPATSQALSQIPRRVGSSMFSALTPGTVIEPHYGPTNVRLRIHIGLSGLDGCTFRVGPESRSWPPCEVLVLDDSYLHAVRHDGTATRVVLIADFWHPDLSDEEVVMLEQLSAVDTDAHPSLVEQQYGRALAGASGHEHNHWWV